MFTAKQWFSEWWTMFLSLRALALAPPIAFGFAALLVPDLRSDILEHPVAWSGVIIGGAIFFPLLISLSVPFGMLMTLFMQRFGKYLPGEK